MKKNSKLEIIKRINKPIVRADGTVDSFDRQLIKLISGVYDMNYPMVVSDNAFCLDYIDGVFCDHPLIMNVSTVIKIRERHEIGYVFVSNCEEMLKNSVLAFDSLKFDSSKVVLLDEFSEAGDPIIAICRADKKVAVTHVNEITSIYDKSHFENFLRKVYEGDRTFYKNKKTERYFKSHWSRLPDDLKYALSGRYYNTSFTKSQVENQKKMHFSEKSLIEAEKLNLDSQIAAAEGQCISKKHIQSKNKGGLQR